MKNKNTKIISLAVILVVLGLVFFLGRSYAYFETSIAGSNVTMGVGKLIHSLNSNVVLKSGEKKEIDLVVKSNDDVASKYQVYYTSSNDLTNILVGYANDSIDLPSGDIDANGSKNITIVFENNSSNDVSIEVGVRGGLSKNTVEDIVLKDGENRVVTAMEGVSESGNNGSFSDVGELIGKTMKIITGTQYISVYGINKINLVDNYGNPVYVYGYNETTASYDYLGFQQYQGSGSVSDYDVSKYNILKLVESDGGHTLTYVN